MPNIRRLSCRHLKSVIGLAFSLLLAACAGPGELPDPPADEAIATEAEHQLTQALILRHAREYRLARVARPLLIAALELCPMHRRSEYGLRLHSIDSYTRQQRPAAHTVYGLDQRPTLRTPLPDSPAAKAGLHAGDRLLRLQGRAFTSETYNSIDTQLREMSGPLSLQIERGDSRMDLTLMPEELCDWPVRLIRSSAINAHADGREIRINQGMLSYAQGDDELALVIAHEIAHNGLQHIDKQLRNLLLGALLDLLALTQGYPSPGIAATLGIHHQALNWELEADLQALVLLHRAGVPLQPGIEFWRRLGTDFPTAIRHSRGLIHPGTAERYLRMKTAAKALQIGHSRD
uniref:M48 family metallopeptidase n=1 Tax=Marinobacterium profundum TaxID=1714300 RepID=UPI00083635DB|nr:M48 family metallopeptidase [Marinobacterium profundum]